MGDCGNLLFAVRGLRKRFGNQVVLDGVDLEVPSNCVTTIVGRSGTGKSVLLKCLVGLIKPDAGDFELHGAAQDLQTAGQNGVHKRGLPRVSFMFQSNALFDSLNVVDNISLPLLEGTSMSRTAVRRRVLTILDKLELKPAGRKFPGELSGGMQKRVALARALVTDPSVVLFDEPTTGLDPERRNAVFAMIAHYRKEFGFTAILVSHDIPEVFYISDHVAWLDQGRIRFFGKPEEMRKSDDDDLRQFLQCRQSLHEADDPSELFATAHE